MFDGSVALCSVRESMCVCFVHMSVEIGACVGAEGSIVAQR